MSLPCVVVLETSNACHNFCGVKMIVALKCQWLIFQLNSYDNNKDNDCDEYLNDPSLMALSVSKLNSLNVI